MKKKRFVFNVITTYGSQIVSMICAFILPRLILGAYGSDVNGLLNSITKFLGLVSLTDMGISVVVQSSLYKPLVDKDNDGLSKVLAAAAKFYRVVTYILFAYTIVLSVLYPIVVKTGFDTLYVVGLILILSVNSISEYLFGITRTQLLNADQRKYVVSITTTFTKILNTVLCSILILNGFGIHVVKLTTMFCFLINPLVYNLYVKKHYNINWKIKYTGNPIKQKWNGLAQHITSYVFQNTDIMVLSLFSTMSSVSVYSVYILVLNGVNQILSAFNSAMQPIMGEYWALGKKDEFEHNFNIYISAMHTIGILFYGCTLTLIIPFVQVYTNGITDANYYAPVFASIITLAVAFQFYRSPYGAVISAIGHFKQTQANYIHVALINIILSVLSVRKFGLEGVGIGTLIASVYSALWQGHYIHCVVLGQKKGYLNELVKNILILFLGYFACSKFKLLNINYFSWIILGVIEFVVWVVIVISVNLLLDRRNFLCLVKEIKKRIFR